MLKSHFIISSSEIYFSLAHPRLQNLTRWPAEIMKLQKCQLVNCTIFGTLIKRFLLFKDDQVTSVFYNFRNVISQQRGTANLQQCLCSLWPFLVTWLDWGDAVMTVVLTVLAADWWQVIETLSWCMWRRLCCSVSHFSGHQFLAGKSQQYVHK